VALCVAESEECRRKGFLGSGTMKCTVMRFPLW